MKNEVNMANRISYVVKKGLFVVAVIYPLYHLYKAIIGEIVNQHRNYKKQRDFFDVTKIWLKNKQQGANISDFFIKKGYKDIAVYGINDLTELFLTELYDSEINVRYGIDMNAEKISTGIKVYKPEDIPEKVDCYVVTAVSHFDQIRRDIGNRLGAPLISIREIVDSTGK